jgi:putative ABC transport system permease protein
VLLVGAGLLIRSFSKLSSVDPGFDARHTIAMELAVGGRYRDQKLVDFLSATLERVRAIPGVEAAGTSHFLPLGNIIPGTGFWRTDHARPAHGEEPVTEVLVVMPGYFAAMSIPIERGRVFDARDRKGTTDVVVINQTAARQLYPNEDPIGKRLQIEWGQPPHDIYEIVGVVGDVRQTSLANDAKPGVFLATMQSQHGPVSLVVRTHGDPQQLAQVIQREIHSIDPDLVIAHVRPMDQSVSASVAAPRFNTILLGGFAALALVLSAVGIFGVISYSVAQRTQELGIRRALGSDTWGVMRLVLGQGLGLTAMGLAIGIAGALAVTRLLGSLLFGVTPTDLPTFGAVTGVLLAVALLACYLPARRAASVDPMEALRHE